MTIVIHNQGVSFDFGAVRNDGNRAVQAALEVAKKAGWAVRGMKVLSAQRCMVRISRTAGAAADREAFAGCLASMCEAFDVRCEVVR